MLISDYAHDNKLKKYGINIKTSYIVGNKIFEYSNFSKEDIEKGIRCRKEYFLNNKLVHTETNFDSRIEYTFVSKEYENEKFKCPNCGMVASISEVTDCCPFCRTNFNVDYIDKDLGTKYYYDYVLSNNKYRIITGIIDLIVSLILAFFFIKFTSRTFNNYDIYKVFIYGILLSLVLYYFFYIIDAYFILNPVKKYKEKLNEKQKAFWQHNKLDKKKFFNNLNYELANYLYSIDTIIDYDIIDVNNLEYYQKDDNNYIKVNLYLRTISFKNNKIKSKLENKELVFKMNKDDVLDLKEGVNILKCHNCGASIDAKESECKFCHTKTKYLQKWLLNYKK